MPKKVKVQLNTPILLEGTARQEAVLQLSGELRELSQAGLWVRVEAYLGEKGALTATESGDLFLPLFKIDHIWEISA